MYDLPPCDTVPADFIGCCVVAVPNTSEWAVACTGVGTAGGPTAVPMVDPAGLFLSAALIAAAALWAIRNR